MHVFKVFLWNVPKNASFTLPKVKQMRWTTEAGLVYFRVLIISPIDWSFWVWDLDRNNQIAIWYWEHFSLMRQSKSTIEAYFRNTHTEYGIVSANRTLYLDRVRSKVEILTQIKSGTKTIQCPFVFLYFVWDWDRNSKYIIINDMLQWKGNTWYLSHFF